jgi:hypothetical protein
MEEALRAHCPPLDPALVTAIASDYDLNDDASREALWALLKDLKLDAEINEAITRLEQAVRSL